MHSKVTMTQKDKRLPTCTKTLYLVWFFALVSQIVVHFEF